MPVPAHKIKKIIISSWYISLFTKCSFYRHEIMINSAKKVGAKSCARAKRHEAVEINN